MSIASTGWQYAQRAARLYPDFVLGTGNEAFSKAMTETIKNRGSQGYFSAMWDGIKKGTVAAEEHNVSMKQKYGGFWKSIWEQLKTAPGEISQGWKSGGVGKTGFGKYWSKLKGSFGALGKRMPLIGTLLIAVTEIPNIFSAFKDKGLIGGITETAKSGARLGAGAFCAGIGSALLSPIPVVGPLLGGLVGWTVGDWLMSKFTGKSHSEKKLEQEQQKQEQLQAMMQNPYQNPYQMVQNPGAMQQIPQPTMNPQQLMAMQQMLYGQGLSNSMDQDFMKMTSGMNRLNYIG